MGDKIPFNHHNLKYFSLARNMCILLHLLLISVEGGVGVSVWGLEDGDLLGFSGWDGIVSGLDEGLGSWP